jgi:hypothetical protein
MLGVGADLRRLGPAAALAQKVDSENTEVAAELRRVALVVVTADAEAARGRGERRAPRLGGCSSDVATQRRAAAAQALARRPHGEPASFGGVYAHAECPLAHLSCWRGVAPVNEQQHGAAVAGGVVPEV